MTENRTQKSIVVIIAAILLGGVIMLVGVDPFLEFPGWLVLWFAVGFGATALAHLISLIIYLITEKDCLSKLLLLCPGVLTLVMLLWACHEKKGFMGYLGAAVIEVLFVLPLGATFLFWLTAVIVRALRNQTPKAD